MSHEVLESFIDLDAFDAYARQSNQQITVSNDLAKKFPTETAFALITRAYTVMRDAFPHNLSDEQIEGMAGRIINENTEVTPSLVKSMTMNEQGALYFTDMLFHFVGLTVDHQLNSSVEQSVALDADEKVMDANEIVDTVIETMKDKIGLSDFGIAAVLTYGGNRAAREQGVDLFKLLRLLSDVKLNISKMAQEE